MITALQHDGRRHAAEQALEQAMAEDFGIRNTIMFHLLKARVLKGGNKVAAALEVLQAGLALPGVRRKRKSSTADGGRRGSASPAVAVAVLPNERCALFLDAAELHAALNNSQEAIKLIAEAKHIFRARPAESGLISIAEAAVATRHGKHRMAIATLSSVPSSSAAAPAAARAKAEVYLLHRRDPRAFIRCFEELTEESASGGHGSHDDAPPRGPGARAAAFVSLGDAHLRIQQPEKAIGAYQAALQLSQAAGVNKGAGGGASGAATLAAKIGRVMTSMHDFEAAIRYYEQSLRGLPPPPSSVGSGGGDGDEAAGAARAALQQQLAGLYNKLGLHDEAGRVLGEALEHIIGPDAEGMGDDEDGMGMGGGGGGMGRIGGGRSSRGRRNNRPIAQTRTDTHNLLLLADVRASRVRAAFGPDGNGEPEALAAEQEEGQALSLARSLAERALQQLSSSDHGGGGRGGHGGGGHAADSADASEVAEQRALVARVLARTAEFELRSLGGAGEAVDPMEVPLGGQQQRAVPGAAGPEFRGAGGGAEGAGGERAAGLYGAALRANAGNVPIMLALARLQLTRGDLEGCQHQCVAILRIENEEDARRGGMSGGGAHSIIEAALASNDEESGGHGGGHSGGGNDEATLILADVMWRRGDTDTALFHFRRLLERSAVAFEALSRLMLLLRFSGKLEDAKPLLEEAERAAHTCSEMAGLRHCQGLYHRYSNDVHEAIRYFNLASRDATWGERSLTHMIEIYINPANENLWEAADDVGGGNDSARAEAVRVADDLLRKLPAMAPRGSSGASSPNRGAFSPGSPATDAGGSMAPGGGALSSARAKRRAVLEAYVLFAAARDD
jgi:tetratricopeptide (TPR) repeat protein